MKPSKLLLAAAVSALMALGGCRSLETRFAVKYNDEVIEYQRSILRQITRLVEAYETRDSTQIFAALQIVQDTTRWARQQIREMPPYDGDSSLYLAAQPLFEFFEKIVTQEYTVVARINSLPDEAITEEHLTTIDEIQQRIQREGIPLNNLFSEAQKQFAREYGFRLQVDPTDNVQEQGGYQE